jgi:septum site-determining protein MinC
MGAMASDSGKPFELEGMVAALNVLRVLTTDLDAIAGALELKIAQSPVLFKGAPVVIDVSALEADEGAEADAAQMPLRTDSALSMAALSATLKARGLVPVGAYARGDARVQEAANAGLPFIDATRGRRRSGPSRKPQPWPDQEKHDDDKTASEQRQSAASAPARAPAGETFNALMLTQPLRGGQIVHATQRDAIALAAVNAGAELIADGNIHVYATLRGRALAGARGNEDARIFCQRLEADLISIAGVYLSADEIPADKVGKAVQISLHNGELLLSELVPK